MGPQVWLEREQGEVKGKGHDAGPSEDGHGVGLVARRSELAAMNAST